MADIMREPHAGAGLRGAHRVPERDLARIARLQPACAPPRHLRIEEVRAPAWTVSASTLGAVLGAPATTNLCPTVAEILADRLRTEMGP